MGVKGVGGDAWALVPGRKGEAPWTRERLLLEAIDDIEDALRGEEGGKGIAPRDRISALKALLDLKLQVVAAREDAREDAAAAVSAREQSSIIRTMGAALRDLRAENEDLKAQIEAHRETQRAWDATAGT